MFYNFHLTIIDLQPDPLVHTGDPCHQTIQKHLKFRPYALS